mgnify:CR=1 FL=1
MFDLVLQAGPVVKLVLLILVYFSLVSWAIIFYKFTLARKRSLSVVMPRVMKF